jgi:hypothetical protein
MNHNTTENDVLSIASIFAEMTDQRKPKGLRLRVSIAAYLIEMLENSRVLRLKLKFFYCF